MFHFFSKDDRSEHTFLALSIRGSYTGSLAEIGWLELKSRYLLV